MTVGPEGPTPPPLPRSIVLTGFMGAGKSTVGRLLAVRLGWRFFDIDAVITGEQLRSVAEIFSHHGEAHYRQLEADAIAAALQRDQQTVIALGGGAIETESVRQLLFPESSATPASMPAAVTIYLAAPLAELLARCRQNSEAPVRPLLTASESPEERLARRLPHYRRAHLTVTTTGTPASAVVEMILAWLSAQSATIAQPSALRSTGAAGQES